MRIWIITLISSVYNTGFNRNLLPDDELQTTISVEGIFKVDLNNLAKEDEDYVASLVSRTYEKNPSATIAFSFDKRIPEKALKRIAISDKSYENQELQQSLRDILQMRRGIDEIGSDEFISCWIRLLRSSKYSPKLVCLLEKMIVENSLSPKIKSLNLSGRCITEENIDSFVRLFALLDSLISLKLSDNRFSLQGAKIMGNAVGRLENLRFLEFSNNWMDDDKMIAFIGGINNGCRRITSLDISSNKFYGMAIETISKFLEVHKEVLTGFNISNNMINDDWMVVLGKALEGCENLTAVDISYNEFGVRGINAFSHAIKKIKMLKSLNIAHNKIGDAEMKILAGGLGNSLESFNVSYNRIGFKGVEIIANALKGTPMLKSLYLMYNEIDSRAMKMVADIIKTCPKFQLLNISYNKVGDDGVALFVNRLELERLGNLRLSLDFSENGISPIGKSKLNDLRSRNLRVVC